MRSIRFFVVMVALALVATACGGSAAETTAATEAPTTTSSTTPRARPPRAPPPPARPSTTTTTIYDGPIAPISGLPVEDETLAARRVIAVKVDNHPDARPQSGLNDADGVIEIIVEGGFTRFIALFHTTDTDYVGPIRSVRPTDSDRAPADERGHGAQRRPALGPQPHRRPRGEDDRRGRRHLPHLTRGPLPTTSTANTTDLRATADTRGYSDEFGTALYEIAPWDEMPAETADDDRAVLVDDLPPTRGSTATAGTTGTSAWRLPSPTTPSTGRGTSSRSQPRCWW